MLIDQIMRWTEQELANYGVVVECAVGKFRGVDVVRVECENMNEADRVFHWITFMNPYLEERLEEHYLPFWALFTEKENVV